MRVGVDLALRLGDVDQAQHFYRAVARFLSAAALVQQDRLDDLLADGEHRIERRHRLLEYHGDVAAANLMHLGVAERQQVAAVIADRAALDAAHSGRDQPHDGERRHALAAAGFTDDTQCLAAINT